jgi:hypothetical protein
VDNSNNETSFHVRETQSGSTWGSTVNMNAAANAVAMTDAGQHVPRMREHRGNSAYRMVAGDGLGPADAPSTSSWL